MAGDADKLQNELAGLDADTTDPDGNPVSSTPKQEEFDELLESEIHAPLADGVAKPEEDKEDQSDEEVVEDETEILRKHGIDMPDLDHLAERYKEQTTKLEALSNALRTRGVQVSDDVLQDLVDAADVQALQERSGLLSGAQPQPQAPAAAPQPQAPTAPAEPAPRPGERSYRHTADLISRYPQLRWTPEFMGELSRAVDEHRQAVEAPDLSQYVSQKDALELVGVIKNAFRDNIINEHVIERMSQGERVPPGYRQLLAKEVEKNPTLLERAWQGYVARGQYNGIMDEYAKGVPVERDPKTGLSKAETDALAEEARGVEASKRSMTGGDAPTTTGKTKEPSVRDLEAAIAREARKMGI